MTAQPTGQQPPPFATIPQLAATPAAFPATAQVQPPQIGALNGINTAGIAATPTGTTPQLSVITSQAETAAAVNAALYQGRPLAPTATYGYTLNGTTSSPVDTPAAMFTPSDFASIPSMINNASSPYVAMTMGPSNGGKLASPPGAGLQSKEAFYIYPHIAV